jgi:hypothetical protein
MTDQTQHDKPKPEAEHNDTVKDVKTMFRKLGKKEKDYMDDFKYRHKITFAFIVFFAINLVWYGMWTIVSDLPILRDPVVSLVLGAIILIATGYFYENMISANLNRKRKKKKEAEDSASETPPKP